MKKLAGILLEDNIPSWQNEGDPNNLNSAPEFGSSNISKFAGTSSLWCGSEMDNPEVNFDIKKSNLETKFHSKTSLTPFQENPPPVEGIIKQGRGLDTNSIEVEGIQIKFEQHKKARVQISSTLQALQKCFSNWLNHSPYLEKDISRWFNTLERRISKRFGKKSMAENSDVQTKFNVALGRAVTSLVPSFLGLLVIVKGWEKQNDSINKIIKTGWKFLKAHLGSWRGLSAQEIVSLDKGKASRGNTDYGKPLSTLEYLMNLGPKSLISSPPVHGLFHKWAIKNVFPSDNSVSIDQFFWNTLVELGLKLNTKPQLYESSAELTFSELKQIMLVTADQRPLSYRVLGMDKKKTRSCSRGDVSKYSKRRSQDRSASTKKPRGFQAGYSLRLLQRCCKNEPFFVDGLKDEIDQWFLKMKDSILSKFSFKTLEFAKIERMIEAGLKKAKEMVVMSFLGVLVLLESEYIKVNTNVELMEKGWEFLKLHLHSWNRVTAEKIKSYGEEDLLRINDDHRNPIATLRYTMSLKKTSLLASYTIYGIVTQWLEWDQSLQRSLNFSNHLFMEKLKEIDSKIIRKHSAGQTRRDMTFQKLNKMLGNI